MKIPTVKERAPTVKLSCSIDEEAYRFVVMGQNNELIFSEKNALTHKSLKEMTLVLGERVDELNLIAAPCQLILLPGQYQLILMDALQMSDEDMIKAFRWRLKGLTDYDLKDLAIDLFSLPTVSSVVPKKVFVALTPLSVLNKYRQLLQSAYLEPTSITIADMALRNCLKLLAQKSDVKEEEEGPFVIISNANNGKTHDKLHLCYQGLFYLIRELVPRGQEDEAVDLSNILAEIERSVDYCVNVLNLPEPKRLIFTPWELLSGDLVKSIKEKLNLDVVILDLNHYLTLTPPMSLKDQHEIFYNIMGALS